MKKINVTVAVLMLVGGAAYGQTNSCTVELQPGFTLIRTPFLDGTNAVNIQDIFDRSLLHQGTSPGTSDNIYIWDPVARTYDAYYLFIGGKCGPAKQGKWLDATTEVASNAVPPNAAFWFVRNTTSTVTQVISGELVGSDTDSLQIIEGMNMVASPFSSEWELNAWPTNWIEQGAVAGAGPASADQILLWDPVPDQLEIFYLHDGQGKNNAGKRGKWVRASDRSIADVTVGLSQGFFYSRAPGAGALNLILEKP